MSPQIGPLKVWVCSFWRADREYGITLYATDPKQIEREHPRIKVLGQYLMEVDE